jgi:hypothetical protein
LTDARGSCSPDEWDIDARTLLLRVLVEGLASGACAPRAGQGDPAEVVDGRDRARAAAVSLLTPPAVIGDIETAGE